MHKVVRMQNDIGHLDENIYYICTLLFSHQEIS